MTFTFSDNHETDYAALGMCPVCAVRFTHGCEHSNTMEAQEWLAAHIVAEQPISITEQDANDISNLIATAESTEGFTDAFCDERIDPQLNCYNMAVENAAYNVLHAIPANKEWAKKRLVEETEKRNRYLGGEQKEI